MKPIVHSLYKCDSVFHTQELRRLLEEKEKFGFIIVDGNGALFGLLQGSTKTIIEKFTVDLPKKHGRGGQSQNRFARIRTERRHNYLRSVCESATEAFITDDMPNVKGIIVAGSADLKSEVVKCDLFDPRLSPVVLKVIDISYGGENGFSQAVDDSEEILGNLKFLHEKKVISRFFEEIAKDSGKFIFGVKETIELLLDGTIDVLILYEDFQWNRVKMLSSSNEEIVKFLPITSIGNKNKYVDEKGDIFEIAENITLTEWLIENYQKYVSCLEIVTNQSSEGSQFVKGFGGIGGILRYKIDSELTSNTNDLAEENFDDFI